MRLARFTRGPSSGATPATRSGGGDRAPSRRDRCTLYDRIRLAGVMATTARPAAYSDRPRDRARVILANPEAQGHNVAANRRLVAVSDDRRAGRYGRPFGPPERPS